MTPDEWRKNRIYDPTYEEPFMYDEEVPQPFSRLERRLAIALAVLAFLAMALGVGYVVT